MLVSSDVAPATIGLGLFYDFDENEKFPGFWAQWQWDTEEDLGTWTLFSRVEDFYYLNVAFDLGDEDDIPVGITAGYDLINNVVFGGGNVGFVAGDDDSIKVDVEAGVVSDFVNVAFGAAGKLGVDLGDDKDIALTVEGWYAQPGFVLDNSGYDPDEIGVKASLAFMLTDEDDDLRLNLLQAGNIMDSAFPFVRLIPVAYA